MISIRWSARRARWLAACGIAVVVIYLLWIVVAWRAQDRLVFPGTWVAVDPDAPHDAAIEVIRLPAAGGYVEGWFQPGAGRSASSPGPAVLYFHGNGDLMDNRWPGMRKFLDRGVSVLCMEYRGYGRSAGPPAQEGILADALAFYDCLAERAEVDAQRIILHGTSIGGGVAGAVAQRRPSAALILECTFTSLRALAAARGVPPAFCRVDFDTQRTLAHFDGPVLMRRRTRRSWNSIAATTIFAGTGRQSRPFCWRRNCFRSADLWTVVAKVTACRL